MSSRSSYELFLSAQHLKVRRTTRTIQAILKLTTQDLAFCMIALATSFTAVRLGIRAWKRRFWLIEDIVVCLAWACFTAMTIGYICVTNAVYRVSKVGEGQTPPYPKLKEDAEYLVKVFFPNTLLLWTTLWLVKFALLLQCRRLVDRRPTYIIVWRIIITLTGVFYIGCIVTEFTSCRSFHHWFTYGQCETERDARASVVSLFYAFAVDIFTDLMIMIFPLRILWNLKLSLVRKISIMAIFGVGVVCILTSIIRVSQISSRAKSRQPSPSWLIVWAIVEAAIAVVVACLPTFGLLLPAQTPDAGYGYGYSITQSQSKTGHRERMQREGIKLRSRQSGQAFQGFQRPIIEGNASRERLKANEGAFVPYNGVLVTTTFNLQIGEAWTDLDEESTSTYRKPTLRERYAGYMV
ncbi:MAG: hypothetical protein L6R40_007168 [Gallowayella cf. fulva]|nr:MAG: hypothetical protein L6R40_007168 [Xanthomendoza cf. fulva]